jgi:ABC-type transport system substrate-binding protein
VQQKKLNFFTPAMAQTPFSFESSVSARSTLSEAIHGQFIYFDQTNTALPGVLKSWLWDAEAKEYILELKEDLYFHNGRLTNSKDLEFSILRFLFSQKSTGNASLLNIIEGAEKVTKGSRFESGQVSGVRLVDEHKIAVKVVGMHQSLLYALALSSTALVPQEELKEDLLEWKNLPVGVGTYQAIAHDPEKGLIVLKKFDESKIHAPEVIDFSYKNPPQNADLIFTRNVAENVPDFRKIIIQQSLSAMHIAFNLKTELGADADFRKAISLALNRKKIFGDLVEFEPLCEVLPSGSLGRANIGENYDVREAQLLMAQVLKKFKVSTPLKVLYVDDGSFRGELQNQLKAAGLDVKFEAVQSFSDNLIHNEDAVFVLRSFGTDLLDPLAHFAYLRNNDANPGLFPLNDTIYNSLFNKAQSCSAIEERMSIVSELSAHYAQLNFSVPLAQKNTSYLVNDKTIDSIGAQRGGWTLYLDRVMLKS